MRKPNQVTLAGLGRGRRWAERAAAGEPIEILGDDDVPVAWLIPATEPITDELLAWYVRRYGGPTKSARRKLMSSLRGLQQGGWRYHRAIDRFVFTPADPGLEADDGPAATKKS